MKRLFKCSGRSDIKCVSSEDEEVTLPDETQGRNDDNLMFDTDEEEVEVEKVVSIAEVTTDSATTTTPAASKPSQDKGKEKMIEYEKPLKKKDQIMYDQEVVKIELGIVLMEDDKEKEDLKQCFKIVQDDEVAIDVIPLATNQLLKEFDREDLENLWKLVKTKHENTRPEEGYERVLWGDLKTMFKHHIEDLIWRNLQGKKVLLWRLYDSSGIHFVRFEDIHVYMLVEKKYPLIPATITAMLNKKLQADYWNEIFIHLLYVFGSLCYPSNDSEDLGKLDAKADIGIFVGYVPTKKAFRIYNRRTYKIMETINVTLDELTTMASEQFGLGPRLKSMTPSTSNSGLVSNPVSQQPFQVAAAPRAVVLADSPMLTSIDQDAPSTSIPSTQEQEHSPIISQGFEESPKTPLFHDDPLHESLHEDSTYQGSSSNVRPAHTPFEHLSRWNHPIANMIGDPSRSVSTRKQLETDVMWCYFNAFLTFVEPNNFKQAMTKPS
ncbi:hypothetical protein Tco_0610836 [Tanacetum coccineum]